ncbi:hypothetical protein A2924_01685 [Candidatus Giovannonibacteria bacterium RIFCSPLOWO2_01_FULL_44_16]|uniref:Uncharacterized protein n=1 Tax=Candidatus Giovannonibacteria bacterium RIFCSPLOWO2_01_FULL_44_16 TaxID=1798348 RepID=A0A1F5X4A9_9BACT|nr:MAG: hypothetical protein A2924_01685 [Candidatus Giovannonibacteria bacterium RIFCSPLOWO2_01_FULL_44_16]
MAKLNPSKEWTRSEREQVILQIADEMRHMMGLLVRREYVHECAERISFLLQQGPLFLEANREKILNGSELPSGSLVKCVKL